jgi:hypothetical protein
MMLLENFDGQAAVRAGLCAGLALAISGCANEPATHRASFAPMMMLSSAAMAPETFAGQVTADTDAVAPIRNVTHKSLAAKVLASRALETVTGLAIDPARLSEHD